jgi:hypothetical protein
MLNGEVNAAEDSFFVFPFDAPRAIGVSCVMRTWASGRRFAALALTFAHTFALAFACGATMMTRTSYRNLGRLAL